MYLGSIWYLATTTYMFGVPETCAAAMATGVDPRRHEPASVLCVGDVIVHTLLAHTVAVLWEINTQTLGNREYYTTSFCAALGTLPERPARRTFDMSVILLTGSKLSFPISNDGDVGGPEQQHKIKNSTHSDTH